MLESDFQAVGFQLSGISQPPSFLNFAKGHFHLRSDDPGIDPALYIPDVNNGYFRNEPDMSAYLTELFRHTGERL